MVERPWWVWLIAVLWVAPGVYFFIALMRMKPLGGMTDEGEVVQPQPPSLLRRLLLSPLVLLIMATSWPLIIWREYRR